MPELRIDPISGLRVIVAGERGSRPGAFLDVNPREPIDPESDPFAAGHEDRTPPEVYALRDERRLEGEGRPEPVPGALGRARPIRARTRSPPAAASPTCSRAAPPRGAHEVVINAPDPVTSLAELDPGQVDTAMSVWRERMRAHDDAAYVHVIVNEGKEAGASLPHTHAQLYALPFVPAAVARERERFTAYSDRTQGRNLLEDLVQEEVRRARAHRRDRRRGRGDRAVRRARAVPPPGRAAHAGRSLLRRRPDWAGTWCTRC